MITDFNSVSIQDEWVPILEKIAEDLVNTGYSLTDNLLPEEKIYSIKDRFQYLLDEDEFQKSAIGKKLLLKVNEEIRGDYIRWIETDDLPPTIETYYNFLSQLIAYFNRHLYIGLKDLESHYAFYPKGKWYLKHRDRFKKNPHRVISVVLYLNENWVESNGGNLIIYDDNLKELKNVAPIINRLAVFKSEMIHEVLPCTTSRYSITTWLLDKEKELTFL